MKSQCDNSFVEAKPLVGSFLTKLYVVSPCSADHQFLLIYNTIAYAHMHVMHMCIIINGILRAMVDLRKNLAKNVRKMRGDAPQTAFAKKAGLNQASINRIELEQQNVTIDTLQKLCTRLKCNVSDLLD